MLHYGVHERFKYELLLFVQPRTFKDCSFKSTRGTKTLVGWWKSFICRDDLHICATVRSYADLSNSHRTVLSTAGQGNSFVKHLERCHQIRVTIQKQNHKYERRAGVVSPPEAARLTFHPSVSVSPATDTNANTERQQEENVRKIKYAYQWETWGDRGQGEDRFSLLPEE